MVKKINSSEFEQVKNNKAIIVDFSAEWCGPCKMLAPVMEQLSDEITDVEFYNIDVDENPDLAREYRIMNIPAVIAIKGGQVAGQQIGLVSKDDMKGFIDGVSKTKRFMKLSKKREDICNDLFSEYARCDA